jgi:hypothetical protein
MTFATLRPMAGPHATAVRYVNSLSGSYGLDSQKRQIWRATIGGRLPAGSDAPRNSGDDGKPKPASTALAPAVLRADRHYDATYPFRHGDGSSCCRFGRTPRCKDPDRSFSSLGRLESPNPIDPAHPTDPTDPTDSTYPADPGDRGA